MEGGLSEFKRAVQATNYGIALRTAASLDALRVMRVPAGLRSGKDLAVGRGYSVKSGQPTMLQIASPYDGLPLQAGAGDGEEDTRIPQALDYWVELILGRHPEPKTPWFAAQAGERAAGGGMLAQPAEDSPVVAQMKQLLRRAMLWETQRREEDPEAEPVLPGLLAQHDVTRWGDEAVLRQVMKALHKAVNGVDDTMYEMIFGPAPDDKDVLAGLETALPELAAAETAEEEPEPDADSEEEQ